MVRFFRNLKFILNHFTFLVNYFIIKIKESDLIFAEGGNLMKIYKCDKCGKMIYVLKDSACTPKCCGDAMTELTANTTDGAREKHVPVVTTNGNDIDVVVGSTEHPMEEKHSIQWIALESEQGVQFKHLQPGDAPKASFALSSDDKLVAAYEYCNLHGLWKA